MSRARSLRRVLAIALLLVSMTAMAGCHLLADLKDYEVLPVATKVDLLIVVDTSRGTIVADKVELFDNAIADLIDGLALRVDDIHVGVVSNSLGSSGADSCEDALGNEHARLLSRGVGGATVATYQDFGFLAWDQQQQATPPGDNDLGAFKAKLQSIVVGAGSEGCGYESTLEAWYRFLVEPEPYAEIKVIDDYATPTGIDTELLAQRNAFLRRDSLLMVVVLSDENDCSLRVGGSSHIPLQIFAGGGNEPFRMARPRKACSLNPNSVCCRSCAQPPAPGCDDSVDECDEPLSAAEDPINLRCFDQKRRFGFDFLNPIDRYVAGLGAEAVADYQGNLQLNPLFAYGRDPRLVVYGSIIGVPLQDIARRNDAGAPDIERGLQTPAEMIELGTWELILGDPESYHTPDPQWPGDPLMRESLEPRTSLKELEGVVHPITKEPLAPPSAKYFANSINGHEHLQPDELQYACVFELRDDGVDCETFGGACACEEDFDESDPLCQDPTSNEHTTRQRLVQAYPGIRHLQLLRRLGERAVVGSICPGESTWKPFAYQPASGALLATAARYLDKE